MSIGKSGTSSFVMALALVGLSGCNGTQPVSVAQAAPAQSQPQTGDPANGNLAPVGPDSQNQAVANAPQPAYAQSQPAPQAYSQPVSQATDASQTYYSDADYDTADNQQDVYASDPPPPLPEYSQPPCPGDDYFWTPGYWNYANAGYYWVPGAWVIAPYVGALWTPPYWGYQGNRYAFHAGYWGASIGFYGGINYGFGYTGRGYYGAYWNHDRVYYNRNVTNVNVNIVHNVYSFNAPVINSTRVSYHGGRGGLNTRPIPAEMAALRQTRVPPVPAQVQHARDAASNRAQFAAVNRGRPENVAASTPLPTSYRTPAAAPPANAMRPGARQNNPQRVDENRQFGQGNRNPEGRPAPQPQQLARPEAAPSPASRMAPRQNEAPLQNQVPPQQRQEPSRPFQRQENRAAPTAAPPVPENRPAPLQPQRPERRPAPEARPVPQPAARPAPEVRSAPQPTPRPAPEARPVPQPAARPEFRARPQQPAARPAPEARPVPQPAARPAPQAGPRPGPPQRQAPQAQSPGQREERKGR